MSTYPHIIDSYVAGWDIPHMAATRIVENYGIQLGLEESMLNEVTYL